mmetsp:Transcript_2884/g.4423  ORF Transcript_2884/g.4423 Transcript_2884/m.4423 type:complete len:437 (-) Transcript_2884:118-1428(-)
MKIRTVAFGLSISADDFLSENGISLKLKLTDAKHHLDNVCETLRLKTGHEIQTQRIAFNSFEKWLVPLLAPPHLLTLESVIKVLHLSLEDLGIHFCSIGCCETADGMKLIPEILSISDRLSASVLFTKASTDDIAPPSSLCALVAETCLQVAAKCGDLGNFRFCASFNCPSGIPFFPAAYQESGVAKSISVGLENGDLLFLAFHGMENDYNTARDQLHNVLLQILLPIQDVVESYCKENSISYTGIDASINPGLALPDSVGGGLQSLLPPAPEDTNSLLTAAERNHYQCFGEMGTLAAVSTVTSAIKSLDRSKTISSIGGESSVGYEGIKLAGYSGLMLPVLEDVVLAQRAQEGRYNLRDLLTFSSVCGVGLDTVPIPGNTRADVLAGVYMEVAALAFRLNKPLSCRVLPLTGKVAGDTTNVDSPYLCNSIVFSIP